MKDSSENASLEELLTHSAEYIQEWITEERNTSGRAAHWWLGLAQAASDIARATGDIRWAEIAIPSYEQASTIAGPDAGEAFIISSMMLRAAMISILGVKPNHPILDPERIVKWFRAATTMSHHEALAKASRWGSLGTKEIQELRQIKNRLAIISQLVEDHVLKPDMELSNWLKLRKKLP